MNKRLKSILQEDTQYAESRTVRLRKTDDLEIANRGGKASPLIAELVHKGLAYERLEKGAGDPVIRQLLKSLNQIVEERDQITAAPLALSVRQIQTSLRQTQIFVATLFLTFTGKLDFPMEYDTQDGFNELRDACVPFANRMLDLILPPNPPPATDTATPNAAAKPPSAPPT